MTLGTALAVMSNHSSYIEENNAKHWFEFEDVEDDDDDYLTLERLLDPKALAREAGAFDVGIHRVDFGKLAKLAASAKPFLATQTKKVAKNRR